MNARSIRSGCIFRFPGMRCPLSNSSYSYTSPTCLQSMGKMSFRQLCLSRPIFFYSAAELKRNLGFESGHRQKLCFWLTIGDSTSLSQKKQVFDQVGKTNDSCRSQKKRTCWLLCNSGYQNFELQCLELNRSF